MLSPLEAINIRTIFLLTTDIKSKKLIGVNMEATVEALKSLNIGAKALAHRCNAMWDILLATEYASNSLTGNILTYLQTESVSTRKAKVTLHGVPLYITEDHLGFFLVEFVRVPDVTSVKKQVGHFLS